MEDHNKEVIEPYTLHYSDLISLSSSSSLSCDEIQRLSNAVMETLGPTGPGLLTITGVPDASRLRNTLLPLARDLSLLPAHLRKRILKEVSTVQDHNLGSDVPLKNLDRSVSSFAMQLNYGDGLVLGRNCNVTNLNPDCLGKDNLVVATEGFDEPLDAHFKDLSGAFKELGLCMTDLGLRVARICDRVIGGTELEDSLLQSGTAKGRLIHYHSFLDNYYMKESVKKKSFWKRVPILEDEILVNFKDVKSFNKSELLQRNGPRMACEKVSEHWQQWHYDYGLFTVLTSPMFMSPKFCREGNGDVNSVKFGGLECSSPSDHTYLQIFHPNKDKICIVKAPPESFILQVGESADILSRSRLRSTLHSVIRPRELINLSRETFVVFLHPAWNKVFKISKEDYPIEQLYGEQRERPQCEEEEMKNLKEEILKKIPPLSLRLKDGMTFAEFSRETTKQYYGGNGLQAKR